MAPCAGVSNNGLKGLQLFQGVGCVNGCVWITLESVSLSTNLTMSCTGTISLMCQTVLVGGLLKLINGSEGENWNSDYATNEATGGTAPTENVCPNVFSVFRSGNVKACIAICSQTYRPPQRPSKRGLR